LLSTQSIRGRVLIRLVIASAILILLFSTLLYNFLKQSLYKEVKDQLIKQTSYIAREITTSHPGESIDSVYLKQTLDIDVKVIQKPQDIDDVTFKELDKDGHHYLVLYYPYNFMEQSFLMVTKDISSIHEILTKFYKTLLFTNMLSFAFIILYGLILSNSITRYITNLTKRLSSMNENMLKPIKLRHLPEEFQPLGNSINLLINRIQTFLKYQKELFIGIAHELKTPLAVMKLKNEVTLIKERTPQEYQETIKLNIKTINEMNRMIENILRIGRQESDQFESPVQIDLIEYLKEKSSNYQLLASSEGKQLKVDLKPKKYQIAIQPTLLNHIIQNLIQNAIKFTKPNGVIELRSYPVPKGIKIEVLDEGPGIDEELDLFAPFKRKGEKGGVGLGLFLAKTAADAMGATIEIRNRKDKKGAVATLFIPSELICSIP